MRPINTSGADLQRKTKRGRKSALPAAKLRKVLVILDLAGGVSARDILSGIFRFVNSGHPWQMRLIQTTDEFTPETVLFARNERFDGVVVTIDGRDGAERALAASALPLVVVDVRNDAYESRKTGISFVRMDNAAVGRMGAQHLASLGKFNSFGFVPDPRGRYWTRDREESFRETLGERGLPCEVFDCDAAAESEYYGRLGEWLAGLPKPAAVMAAWDQTASQVLVSCADRGIAVPEQIVLLGVDNDELLCDYTSPRLTSILPDHEGLGFRAAEEMERILAEGGQSPPQVVGCGPRRVIERETTRWAAPASVLLKRALAFIDKNATRGIGVGDVVSLLGTSRRLAEMRFRELQGTSIHAYILSRRLDAVKSLLRKTRLPVNKIARQCGFADPNYLSHLFAKKVGCSMRRFREDTKT